MAQGGANEGPRHSTDATAHEGERHGVHHDLPEHGHNPSSQRGVAQNEDITLHYSHEHQHNHMHHAPGALTGRTDDILFAKGTTLDKSNIHEQDHSHHAHSHLPMTETKDHIYNETTTSSDIEKEAEKGEFDATRVDTNDYRRSQETSILALLQKVQTFLPHLHLARLYCMVDSRPGHAPLRLRVA